VDIVVAKDTPVKATADGIVVFAEWTASTGYVIILEHSYGLISIYKHNAALTKVQGDLVKAGEVIATAGRWLQVKKTFFGKGSHSILQKPQELLRDQNIYPLLKKACPVMLKPQEMPFCFIFMKRGMRNL